MKNSVSKNALIVYLASAFVLTDATFLPAQAAPPVSADQEDSFKSLINRLAPLCGNYVHFLPKDPVTSCEDSALFHAQQALNGHPTALLELFKDDQDFKIQPYLGDSLSDWQEFTHDLHDIMTAYQHASTPQSSSPKKSHSPKKSPKTPTTQKTIRKLLDEAKTDESTPENESRLNRMVALTLLSNKSQLQYTLKEFYAPFIQEAPINSILKILRDTWEILFEKIEQPNLFSLLHASIQKRVEYYLNQKDINELTSRLEQIELKLLSIMGRNDIDEETYLVAFNILSKTQNLPPLHLYLNTNEAFKHIPAIHLMGQNAAFWAQNSQHIDTIVKNALSARSNPVYKEQAEKFILDLLEHVPTLQPIEDFVAKINPITRDLFEKKLKEKTTPIDPETNTKELAAKYQRTTRDKANDARSGDILRQIKNTYESNPNHYTPNAYGTYVQACLDLGRLIENEQIDSKDSICEAAQIYMQCYGSKTPVGADASTANTIKSNCRDNMYRLLCFYPEKENKKKILNSIIAIDKDFNEHQFNQDMERPGNNSAYIQTLLFIKRAILTKNTTLLCDASEVLEQSSINDKDKHIVRQFIGKISKQQQTLISPTLGTADGSPSLSTLSPSMGAFNPSKDEIVSFCHQIINFGASFTEIVGDFVDQETFMDKVREFKIDSLTIQNLYHIFARSEIVATQDEMDHMYAQCILGEITRDDLKRNSGWDLLQSTAFIENAEKKSYFKALKLTHKMMQQGKTKTELTNEILFLNLPNDDSTPKLEGLLTFIIDTLEDTQEAGPSNPVKKSQRPTPLKQLAGYVNRSKRAPEQAPVIDNLMQIIWKKDPQKAKETLAPYLQNIIDTKLLPAIQNGEKRARAHLVAQNYVTEKAKANNKFLSMDIDKTGGIRLYYTIENKTIIIQDIGDHHRQK